MSILQILSKISSQKKFPVVAVKKDRDVPMARQELRRSRRRYGRNS